MVRLAARLQRRRQMMLGIKGKKISREDIRGRNAMRLLENNSGVSGYRLSKVFFSVSFYNGGYCCRRRATTMEGTVVEEELREEFGIVESNIDEIECSLGRENVGESEEDFVAAESSYDYDNLFNFEVSVAIAETETDEMTTEFSDAVNEIDGIKDKIIEEKLYGAEIISGLDGVVSTEAFLVLCCQSTKHFIERQTKTSFWNHFMV